MHNSSNFPNIDICVANKSTKSTNTYNTYTMKIYYCSFICENKITISH